MKSSLITILPALAVALIGGTLVTEWLSAGVGADVELRAPGADMSPAAPAEPVVDIAGFFARGTGVAGGPAGSWPGFRGPGRDAVSTETVPLTRSLSDAAARTAWSADLGEGYAGPAVADGRVYMLDYDQRELADVLRCLSLADGSEIWRRGYHVKVKRNHGMSRTVPAVADGFVVTLGPKCQVMCAEATTGEFRWGIDLVRDYGATVPDWYAGQCPLIDEGKAILAPGGEKLMVAVDCATGREVWHTPNEDGWLMTHSSVVPMDFAGRRMYVYCASGGAVGVAADDGRVLWNCDSWTVNMANCPSPVIVGDGRIFLTGGYGSGSMMLRLVDRGDGRIGVEELFRLTPQQFGSEQQTPVLVGGHIYGVRDDGQLVCLDLDGNILWTSGREHRFGANGRGPYVAADGMLIVLDGEGTLHLVDASPDAFSEIDSARVLDEGEAWGPMALAGGRLLARDLLHMIAIDIRADRGGE
jgi:outer membrane protein assembly factor BamB